LGIGQQRPTLDIEDVRRLHGGLAGVDLGGIRPKLAELVVRVRHAGLPLSDRRAVKLQRLVAASALLCGRQSAAVSDLWVFRHVWDTMEQREVLAAIVQDVLKTVEAAESDHPRARGDAPDPEALARELDDIEQRAQDTKIASADRAVLKDRLGLLSGRCEWVRDDDHRKHLTARVQSLWSALG